MRKLIAAFLLLCTFSCKCYDPKLEEPDCCGGGYILTPLGRLIYGPWQTNGDFGKNNEAIYLDGKEISSIGTSYSPLQKDLVFQLLRDGSVKFWFKNDYDSSLRKNTSPDSNGITIKTDRKPNESEIRKVYRSGMWKADFRDSSLVIDFGKDVNGLPQLKGKYKDLGSDLLGFQQISYFDSIYLGNKRVFKKVITTHYEHPWVTNF